MFDFPIEELELGVRAYNILKRHNVDTCGQLLEVTVEDANDWVATNPNHALGFRAAQQIIEACDSIRNWEYYRCTR